MIRHFIRYDPANFICSICHKRIHGNIADPIVEEGAWYLHLKCAEMHQPSLFGDESLLWDAFVNPHQKQWCVLPGWFCEYCKVFNGEAKEVLTRCRACDKEK